MANDDVYVCTLNSNKNPTATSAMPLAKDENLSLIINKPVHQCLICGQCENVKTVCVKLAFHTVKLHLKQSVQPLENTFYIDRN